ncbi:glycosyltransferase [Methanomethylovorans sp.]|uniref:glycosyltransferase n=1 Tax=Methanomethylovorans sp. TaxID=2758717 RepID=UPI002FDD5109
MKKVGVIGLGTVGWAVIHGLNSFFECSGYDIEGEYEWDSVVQTDIIFICVSTPLGDNDRLECSNVTTVLDRLNTEKYQGCVVIKSTVSVGYCEYAKKQFPNIRLVYMPEFLREKSPFTWFLYPDRLVLSGSTEDVNEVISFFTWVKGAETLVMDYKSAEIGKLAHNAFIATKVSFTNEVESICDQVGASPLDVMSIIWADRRVKSKEHLNPFLGPYAGKCVPKDTHELIETAHNATLLTAVENVNKFIQPLTCMHNEIKNIVIIPTKNRPNQLKRALRSVVKQTLLPDYVVVVYEEDDPSKDLIFQVVSDFTNTVKITLLANKNTKNLSGAANTALKYLFNEGINRDNIYVCFLDDDDWWDRRYLQNNSCYATETNAEWIISGLIRHDEIHPEGLFQNIPENIFIESFLVSNPNIQGSNLFVKLSSLTSIGGFDEHLPSTTDRDICIRLLDAGISYAVLRNHLVHHDAFSRPDRLSYAGSQRKTEGTLNFYSKYKSRMNGEQIGAFKERAQKLFGVEVPE